MLTTTTPFDSINDATYKTPVFIISFDGETVKYVNGVRIMGGSLLAEDDSFLLLEGDGSFITLEGSAGVQLKYLNYDNGTGTFTAGNAIVSAQARGRQ